MSGTDWELTPNYGLYKPFIDADDDQWGTHLNLNSDVLDAELFNVAQSLGNYLPLSGGALTGPLTTSSTIVAGGNSVNQPAKIGAGDGGISYTALGAGGANIAFIISAGNPYIFQNGVNVGGAFAMQSWVNSNYLLLAGGQMSGPLISSLGSGPTSPGIGIGDNATGFRRSGVNTLLAVGGGDTMQFGPTSTQALQPFLLSADATQPLQAVTYQQLMAHAFVDAPSDGFLYGRENAAWMRVPPGIADAPTDGRLYARSSANWSDITAANAASPNNTGRNLIHNPMFNVQQRGQGPWNTSGAYTADRWMMGFAGGSLAVNINDMTDIGRQEIGDESAHFNLGINCVGGNGAGDQAYVEQHIEDVRRLAGRTVTVSFWAAATAGAGRLGVNLFQIFGTGGTPSSPVTVPGQAVTPGTNVFTYHTLTFVMPSVAGMTLGTNGDDATYLRFWLSAGANNAGDSGGIGVQSFSMAIWGIQLEIGPAATPISKRDPEQELALCQRFYQTHWFSLNAYAVAPSGAAVGIVLNVTMRASPTMILLTNNNSANLDAATAYPDPDSPSVGVPLNSTGNFAISMEYAFSADL